LHPEVKDTCTAAPNAGTGCAKGNSGLIGHLPACVPNAVARWITPYPLTTRKTKSHTAAGAGNILGIGTPQKKPGKILAFLLFLNEY